VTLRRVLVEMSVTEQRYRAVLEVQAGVTVTEVADRFGVSRQAVHRWLGWYADQGLEGLADRSSRPHSSPGQTSPDVEAAICELRRAHPRWGARRLVFELGRRDCPGAIPSRMIVHRVLIRHGLIDPTSRRRRRQDYRRWQRERPMELWQLDIVGGVRLAGGGEAKVVTGVDDHSRFCVIAAVVRRATGRVVCLAFVEALQRFGIPEEVLTDIQYGFRSSGFECRPAGGARFWLGPTLAGTAITLWADATVVHLLTGGVRLKTVPSRLTVAQLRQLLADGGQPAGPPPITTGAAQPGGPIEVERLVNATGLIGLAGRQHPVGSHFAG
jgi:transposase-like protein